MTGKVKRKNLGFGFITASTGQDVFFHKSALIDCCFEWLREGQRVEFTLEDSPKGLRATSISVIE